MSGVKGRSGRRSNKHTVDIEHLLNRSVDMVNEYMDDAEISKQSKFDAALKLALKLVPDRVIHEAHAALSFDERMELASKLHAIVTASRPDQSIDQTSQGSPVQSSDGVDQTSTNRPDQLSSPAQLDGDSSSDQSGDNKTNSGVRHGVDGEVTIPTPPANL